MVESSLGPDRIKHLEFIQAVITRLSTSSFLVKGWALTLVAAFLALQEERPAWETAAIAAVPILAFWLLDGYLLWQERLYRYLYDDARRPGTRVELLSMHTQAYRHRTSWAATAVSRTVLLFYGALLVLSGGFAFLGGMMR